MTGLRYDLNNMITKRHQLKSFWASLLVLGFAMASSNSMATEDTWTVRQLMQQLSKVSYARLNFVETRQSIFLSSDMVIEGSMEYRAPDYMVKTTLSPTTEKVVVDGDSMVVQKLRESGKKGAMLQTKRYSIQSHPVLQAAVGSIRSVLAGNYELLSKNYVIMMDGLYQNWTLELVPKSAKILEYVEKITLSGKDVQIRQYVTLQTDGDESVMKLSYEVLNKEN